MLNRKLQEHKVEILMGTYNGEKYLKEQIESLLIQTHTNWTLLIRDDGSNDKTIQIIESYEKKYPEKIKVLRDNKKNLGVQYNFLELLKNSKENYIMFCDQDDVWLKEKIEETLKVMIEHESQNVPILVFTDLKVVDENLNIINDSFWKYQRFNIENNTYKKLLIDNHITGCTIMMNKPLKELTEIKFENIIMHDWLVAILASLKGEIYPLKKSLILYRQHIGNCVGAKKEKETLLDLIKKILILKTQIKEVKVQANNIIKKIKVDKKIKKIILEYINLKEKNYFKRKLWIIRNEFVFQNKFIKKIIQIIIE